MMTDEVPAADANSEHPLLISDSSASSSGSPSQRNSGAAADTPAGVFSFGSPFSPLRDSGFACGSASAQPSSSLQHELYEVKRRLRPTSTPIREDESKA